VSISALPPPTGGTGGSSCSTSPVMGTRFFFFSPPFPRVLCALGFLVLGEERGRGSGGDKRGNVAWGLVETVDRPVW
jgi:hypothetical protein